ncbi:putative TMV resistance protein N-like [Sesbania bispinosa]|nr:putative TMV resistance protein N-like [Sesbania bispinosa]
MAHDILQDNLDIYDEASGDVDFPTLLAKYFTKNMLEVMENLQASKGKDDNGHGFDEELELDSDTDIDNQHMEEEQHSASLNHQILENCELMNNDKGKDTKSSKIFLDPLIATQEELLVNKEPTLAQKAKLKEKENFPLESSTIASTSRNKETQLGDIITYGEQINIGFIKSKEMARNQVKSNAEEAILHFNKNQADIYERIDDGGQQLVPNTEAYIKTNESTINEVSMEAFYVALEAETTSPSHVQDPQPNNIFVKTRSSEETKKALHILRDFVSKHFSLLLHPGHLSKAEKVKDDLEANVKDFREIDMVEKCLCNQLVCLQEKKRELEEKINAIKAEIADFTAQRQMAAKRKIELFHEGRVMKVERDDLRNKVPRLKAEQEWAKITQANIEAEWSKLGEQFIGSTNFEEWI